MPHDCGSVKKKDHPVSFILSNTSPEVRVQVAGDYPVLDNPADSWMEPVLSTNGDCLLVIDSDDENFYKISFQRKIRESGAKLMYITVDDRHAYEADLILNQNIRALSQEYSVAPHTRLLLGPQHFIFREQFRVSKVPYEPRGIYSLLISFGGGDQHNLTSLALRVLGMQPGPIEHIHVVCGGLNPHLEEVKTLVEVFNPRQISLHIDTPHMLEIMEECDAAITSFGLTFWELVVRGLPSLVIASSERERSLYEYLQHQRYFQPVGVFTDPDLEERLAQGLSEVVST